MSSIHAPETRPCSRESPHGSHEWRVNFGAGHVTARCPGIPSRFAADDGEMPCCNPGEEHSCDTTSPNFGDIEARIARVQDPSYCGTGALVHEIANDAKQLMDLVRRLRNVQIAGWERAAKAEARVAAFEAEAERLRAVADALHASRFAKEEGTLRGPDNFYNGTIQAERALRTALEGAPQCTCDQGDDDCIPCGSPGDATGLQAVRVDGSQGAAMTDQTSETTPDGLDVVRVRATLAEALGADTGGWKVQYGRDVPLLLAALDEARAEVERWREKRDEWRAALAAAESARDAAEGVLSEVRGVERHMADCALKAWASASARHGLSDEAALTQHADALSRWSERLRAALAPLTTDATEGGGEK